MTLKIDKKTFESICSDRDELALSQAEAAHQATGIQLKITRALKKAGAHLDGFILCMYCGHIRAEPIPKCTNKECVAAKAHATPSHQVPNLKPVPPQHRPGARSK